jgi:sugar-specific transcriptional regulator TrmB
MKKDLDKNLLEGHLNALGFNSDEVLVYQVMLKLGKASPAEIIKESGLKRGNTYNILYRLEELKLISRFQKDYKLHFQIEHPTRLQELATEQKKEAESIEKGIQSILPNLQEQYSESTNKPSIEYYEGESGIIEVFEDIYAKKDDIVLGTVDFEIADIVFPQYIVDKLIPKRIKNKVTVHSIFADSETSRKLQEKDREQFRKCYLVDKEKYPIPAEIDTYEDKIAMMTFDKGKFVALLINNKQLATAMKSIFKLAMIGAKLEQEKKDKKNQ